MDIGEEAKPRRVKKPEPVPEIIPAKEPVKEPVEVGQ